MSTPKKFFEKNSKYCNKKQFNFIIDECTTGFRERYGGLYVKYNLKPDIVIYGKSLEMVTGLQQF